VKLEVPDVSSIELDDLLREVRAPRNLRPFSEQVIELAAELSSTLLRNQEARQFKELQALGFWMRKAEVLRLKEEYESLHEQSCVLVPRGVVFHIPPANVDTLFVYSWMLALLSGNGNVVRLSQCETAVGQLLCRFIRELLHDDAFKEIRDSTHFVRYGHDDGITTAISQHIDMRVVWGGDSTVAALRRIPLAPRAKELAFPDRWSLAAINSAAWLSCQDVERTAVAERFFNDAFLFDQVACSSPRWVLFCGDQKACQEAQTDFFLQVVKVVRRRNLQLPTEVVLEKQLLVYRAVLDTDITSVKNFGNEVAVLQTERLDRIPRMRAGVGSFFAARTESLENLVDYVQHRDQTLAVFGFRREELRELALHLNGRGIDRIVSVGRALAFNRFWDGYDLLHEFMKYVHIDVAGSEPVAPLA
jgi:hypothetical protein